MNTIHNIACKIVSEIKKIGKANVIVAIDGRCGSGKTTISQEIQKLIDCNVFAMDHFFLRPEQRTPERLATPGGNVDRERFVKEILPYLKENKVVTYCPFNCRTQQMDGEVTVQPKAVSIIEGSYSCHPELAGEYDLTVFFTVSEDEQMRRIVKRNGVEGAKMFAERWIPLEERYFGEFGVEDSCDVVFDTTSDELA